MAVCVGSSYDQITGKGTTREVLSEWASLRITHVPEVPIRCLKCENKTALKLQTTCFDLAINSES